MILALTTRSYPTRVAAEHFGIPEAFAFLVGDMVRAAVCPGTSAWPEDHAWHVWAVRGAEAAAGKHPTRQFVVAMADYYAEAFPQTCETR